MLFNEPKLLKSNRGRTYFGYLSGFSALQRAEIAEMVSRVRNKARLPGFSALQRAEIAEITIG